MKKAVLAGISVLALTSAAAAPATAEQDPCNIASQASVLCHAVVDDVNNLSAFQVVSASGDGRGGDNHVDASCVAKGAVNPGNPQTDPTTWGVVAQASSSSSKTGNVPEQTGVVCSAYDTTTGWKLGEARLGLFGPRVAIATTINVPALHGVRFVVTASAGFSDGSCADTEGTCG